MINFHRYDKPIFLLLVGLNFTERREVLNHPTLKSRASEIKQNHNYKFKMQ